MQAVAQEREQLEDGRQNTSLVVSFEWFAYILLLTLVLWLRLGQLDTVPISEIEAREGLAAWRALHADLPGSAIVSQSPLLFGLHSIAFTVLGASEFSLRIFTALAGSALVLSPLLFRSLLGPGRAFLLSIMLAASPVILVASRFDSPVIWSLGAGVLGLWALWRWWESEQGSFVLLASGMFSVMILLSDPLGWVYALVLAVSGIIAIAWNRIDARSDDPLPGIRTRLAAWPWTAAFLTVGLTVLLPATLFMTYLPGLASVGGLLGAGLGGVLMADSAAPPVFALLTAVFYEPWLWFFALASLWVFSQERALTLLDRFLAAWAVLAALVPLLYRGTGPAHALWIIMPMTVLASRLAADLFRREVHPFLNVPDWGKPVAAISMFGLLAVLALSFQHVARGFLQTPDGLMSPAQVNVAGLLLMLMSLLLIGAAYFLMSSLWGTGAAARAFALGFFAFMLISSLGSGWAAAVDNATNPAEFWHPQATGPGATKLRETVIELTHRESGGFAGLPMYVQAEDDGVVAWLLRDFDQLNYITEAVEGRTQEIVLLPAMGDPPDLRGSYVGQDFAIHRTWSMNSLIGFDFLSWWAQRRTRALPQRSETMVLWLRQDVYDGVKFEGA